MKGGVNALVTIPWMQLDAVNQGSEHVRGFVPDGRVVQCVFELLDLFGIDVR